MANDSRNRAGSSVLERLKGRVRLERLCQRLRTLGTNAIVIKTANEVEHGASEAAGSKERHAAAYWSVWSVVLTLSASARSRAPAAPIWFPPKSLPAPACARARPSATMRHAPACVLQCVCVHAALVNTSSQHAAESKGQFQRLPWAQHRRVRRPHIGMII